MFRVLLTIIWVAISIKPINKEFGDLLILADLLREDQKNMKAGMVYFVAFSYIITSAFIPSSLLGFLGNLDYLLMPNWLIAGISVHAILLVNIKQIKKYGNEEDYHDNK